MAVVLGCSDSRVPPETVFDQGVGRLFVVRVAGNFAGRTQIGSIEYAVDQLGCSLVVVLGHSYCGAIGAVLAELRHPTGKASPALRSVFDHLRPAVESLAGPAGIPADEEEFQRFYRQAVRANIRFSVARLREDSAILTRKTERGEALIVGAECDLATGRALFLEPDNA